MDIPLITRAGHLPEMSLHHVGIAVKDIHASADIYVRRYGYTPRTAVIHDPTQTAYVQFFQLAGDSCYLELVAPDGAESKLQNVIKRGGGGLHHLCYSVSDIAGDCARLRSSGMLLISAPIGAAAFHPRRIAWLMGRDRLLIELVERGGPGEL
jgi:methylmalonyl-CoA/ethylmalonyl-CoA epimerase